MNLLEGTQRASAHYAWCVLHHTECHCQEQMAPVATMLWHSILQNDTSLLNSEGYWFLSMFPACSIAWVTTTTTLYVKYSEGIQKVYLRVLNNVRLALCPGEWWNPLTHILILLSQQEPGFSFSFSFLKGLQCEKAPCMELRRSCGVGCGLKVRPTRSGPSVITDHQVALDITPPLWSSVSPSVKAKGCTKLFPRSPWALKILVYYSLVP